MKIYKDKKSLQEVIDTLEPIVFGQSFNLKNLAICSLIDKSIQKYFYNWEHFSGEIGYPIPDPDKFLTPYQIFWNHSNKWDPASRYCMLRFDLAKHIIQQCSVDIHFDDMLKSLEDYYNGDEKLPTIFLDLASNFKVYIGLEKRYKVDVNFDNIPQLLKLMRWDIE